MKRFLTLLAATAASAAVTAAITLPAGASDTPKQNAGNEVEITELTACLRAHGLTPPADLEQLKPWLVQQSDVATLKACGFDPPSKVEHGDKPDAPCAAPATAEAAAAKRKAVAAKHKGADESL